ncbi:MAG: tRNA uridine-5-carboxymethylaminomethyl(34) synthesis GTPase MnmE [Spirochaetales bacterium]|nr:tRNA uridine-5-carboxymethylaminomethyl(34) synthesis GTPase MnmE [Spirochaetales bacterium]
MKDRYIDVEDLIAARATPPGISALAIVRVAGPGCVDAVSRAFSRPERLRAAEGRTLVRGALLDIRDGRPVDDLVAAVFRAPESPTGQDQVDFMTHGSPAVVAAVVDALAALGFRKALPGEFSFRAFVAGKADLVESEAIDELSRARTAQAREAALRRLGGGPSAEIARIRTEVHELLAACEVLLDYPEDEVAGNLTSRLPAARGAVEALAKLSAGHAGARLRLEGARVAVAGRTNAGKSSLFNRFLREERSIVSDEHGTTRDWIEASVDLEGIPIVLHDTAGLRSTDDRTEAEGVRRSRLLLESADLILYVVDGTVGLAEEDGEFLAERPDALPVWNKADAPGCGPVPEGFHSVSALDGRGFQDLALAMVARLPGGSGSADGLAGERQAALVEAARASLSDAIAAIGAGEPLDLVSLDLRAASDSLGELTGETASPDVLETIFTRFCVGK